MSTFVHVISYDRTLARSRLGSGGALIPSYLSLAHIQAFPRNLSPVPEVVALLAVVFGPAGLAGWSEDVVGSNLLEVQSLGFFFQCS